MCVAAIPSKECEQYHRTSDHSNRKCIGSACDRGSVHSEEPATGADAMAVDPKQSRNCGCGRHDDKGTVKRRFRRCGGDSRGAWAGDASSVLAWRVRGLLSAPDARARVERIHDVRHSFIRIIYKKGNADDMCASRGPFNMQGSKKPDRRPLLQ